jgi:4-hydroxy-2-oxoheptanedioate aldolase
MERDGFVDGVREYTFAEGVRAADTWADIILVIMEHEPFDVAGLREFMRGLVQGGPTRSGHRTPAVVVELPFSGTDETVVRANAWMVNQALATGVHGLLLCHADTPEGVRAFVESARYPFQKAGVGGGVGEGRRGSGGQVVAAEIWGLSAEEYFRRADAWPLNRQGELLLGIKPENRRALASTEANVRVPGVGFVEWAPLDMSLSLGTLGGTCRHTRRRWRSRGPGC